jgi:hypothetical protein
MNLPKFALLTLFALVLNGCATLAYPTTSAEAKVWEDNFRKETGCVTCRWWDASPFENEYFPSIRIPEAGCLFFEIEDAEKLPTLYVVNITNYRPWLILPTDNMGPVKLYFITRQYSGEGQFIGAAHTNHIALQSEVERGQIDLGGHTCEEVAEGFRQSIQR